MKFAETEGTDINFIAETEGTDITQLAESEGTDLSASGPRGFLQSFKLSSAVLLLIFAQTLFATNINLYTNDGENFKGVISSEQKIDFIEGFIENNKGYFILNNSLLDNKATDEGTGSKATDEGTGVPATDEGTGGLYATDEGTGVPATDEGTGGLYATDEGTGVPATDEGTGGLYATDEGTGVPATDEGTGGLYATDEGTGKPSSSQSFASVLTISWNCNNDSTKATAQLESTKGFQQLNINQIRINGAELNCN